MTRSALLLAAGLASLAGCTAPMVMGDPAAAVYAKGETAPVATANADAADDPAIWRNAADPAASLIVATDKKAGLHVYDLAGREKGYLAAPGLNNVDLIELADGTVLVAASDRGDLTQAHIRLARLDTATGALVALGRVAVGTGEGYGLCFGTATGSDAVEVFSPVKEGTIYHSLLRRGADGVWSAQAQGTMAVPSQPEGCAYDARTRQLYVGEERAGIWRFDIGTRQGQVVARADNRQLVPDVEGLALAPQGADGGWLIVSSQGDNSYARYRLPDMTPMGRFRVAPGVVGAAEETDGIALDTRDFGDKYPSGLLVVQDGHNAPSPQNFKLVSWGEVQAALDQ